MTNTLFGKDGKLIKLIRSSKITSGKADKSLQEVKLFEDLQASTFYVYVLCTINGIYRFSYVYAGISLDQSVLFDP